MCFEFSPPDYIESLSEVVDAENKEDKEKKEIESRLEALERRWQTERLERRHRNKGTKNYPTGHIERGGPSTERYSGELRSTTNKRRRRKDVELTSEGLGDYIVEKKRMDSRKINGEEEDGGLKQSKIKVLPKGQHEIVDDSKTNKNGERHRPKHPTGDSDDLPTWMYKRDPTRRFE